jgi:hypothetical protein
MPNEERVEDRKGWFAVKTRFTFTGTFFVNAENKTQAREYAEQHCGLVMGGSVHSSLSAEEVDWDFPAHPEKGVLSVKRTKRGGKT